MLIYSKHSTSRLEYISDLIFSSILGTTVSITTDLEEFKLSADSKINYSDERLPDSIQILPHDIIFEKKIINQKIDCSTWNGLPIFFQKEGIIPFDIFGAIFYLVSRYEEYLTNEKDEFERFPHELSLAFKNNFLHLPLVDMWAQEFKKVLLTHYPKIKFAPAPFQFIPTYDIDIAYSYLYKGVARSTGGFLADLLKGNLKAVAERQKVLANNQQDPYDSYAYLDDLHERHSLEPVYFFLVGQNGPLDKNLDPKHPEVSELIKSTSEKYAVGIHPSYQSHQKNSLPSEKEVLEKITQKNISKSRQHYIRFALPDTYQKLIQNGIAQDYSMGYGSINGFRASTSHAFYWFDLSENKKTDLSIQPFCFMECNSFFEQKQTLEETERELAHYVSITKETQGQFCSVWHNFSLGTDPIWDGWRTLFEKNINSIVEIQNT